LRVDPVIEDYKKDIDRTLLRENLKLTVEERFRKRRQPDRSELSLDRRASDYEADGEEDEEHERLADSAGPGGRSSFVVAGRTDCMERRHPTNSGAFLGP
jgi:hypothetical protein